MKYLCISIILLSSFIAYSQNIGKLGTVDCSSHYLDSAYIVDRLADSNIMEFCKTLYFNPKKAGDNLGTSIILDTLENSTDFKRLPFYFYCITNTIPYSDGAYTEGIGFFAHKLLKERTHFFIDVFVCSNKMDSRELSLWAKAIARELYIYGFEEEKQKETLEKLKKEINKTTSTLDDMKKRVAQMMLESIDNELEILIESNAETINDK